ncbi:MAG: hypothetical protein ABR879_06110, partial [Methanomassiliicoccales archaeon]
MAGELKNAYPKANLGKDIPWGAVGVYTYFDGIATVLKQLMAGSRKFTLANLARDDICAFERICQQGDRNRNLRCDVGKGSCQGSWNSGTLNLDHTQTPSIFTPPNGPIRLTLSNTYLVTMGI